ncbi:MAG: hypothetical protein CME64_03880 [Halobacteriovoraceae bacterium]|nr:hypothetical protein [Halobacteriovoraceae bacterium]|tara:strand:+ start:53389 stop:54117 length:729 start_codon:yes stop_codon:yes gene_type:complete
MNLKYKYYAICPARKGSKRVIDKNIKPLNDTPLFQYTVNFLEKLDFIHKSFISTNDKRILDFLKEHSNIEGIRRADKLCEDKTSDLELLTDYIENLNLSSHEINQAVIILLRPTSPIRKVNELLNMITMFESDKFTSVRSVVKAQGVHHPYWMFSKEDNGTAREFVEGKTIQFFHQSQLLPDAYRLTGTYDLIPMKNIFQNKNLYGSRMGLYETEMITAIDIDTEFDWKVAEALIKGLSHEK